MIIKIGRISSVPIGPMGMKLGAWYVGRSPNDKHNLVWRLSDTKVLPIAVTGWEANSTIDLRRRPEKPQNLYPYVDAIHDVDNMSLEWMYYEVEAIAFGSEDFVQDSLSE